MKFYAASWSASAPVCIEECVQVVAFTSRAARDAYVAEGRSGTWHGSARDVGSHVRTWSRETLTRDEAAHYLGAILRGAYGRGDGRAALRQVMP